MWEKIKAELSALFGTQKTELIEAVKSAAVMNPKIEQIEADLSTARQSIVSLTAQNSELTAKLEKAQNEVNAGATQITTLKAEVETEKKRANETLAKMGIDPDKIPSTPANDQGADVVSKLQAETDPIKRAKLFKE